MCIKIQLKFKLKTVKNNKIFYGNMRFSFLLHLFARILFFLPAREQFFILFCSYSVQVICLLTECEWRSDYGSQRDLGEEIYILRTLNEDIIASFLISLCFFFVLLIAERHSCRKHWFFPFSSFLSYVPCLPLSTVLFICKNHVSEMGGNKIFK